jgi:hypothetical protein
MNTDSAYTSALAGDAPTVSHDWKTVERDGYPRYDQNITYIGINSAGFACCFTIVDVSEGDDACWMHTGEEHIRMMTDLRWWRVLDRPAPDDSAASSVPAIKYTSWCDKHRRGTPCDKCAATGDKK